MFRLRRYRVFLILAALTLFFFYKFSGSSSWQPATVYDKLPKPDSLKHKTPPVSSSRTSRALKEVAKETKKPKVEVPLAETPQPLVTPPPAVDKAEQKQSPRPSKKPAKPEADGDNVPQRPADLHEHGDGRVEISPMPTSIEPIHWEPQSEHFPVPSGSTIQLPKGSPKPFPKIQHKFKKESAEAKADRETKLNLIKEHFVHSWNGYKNRSWLHDELSPVSGGFRDPFAGWGATLVDALDTLWIMGLKDEFEEAVEGVKKIDFTTTVRSDIPVFETTIRYLGGLLAAYDLSGRKYKTLLDKAVELGDILMGAFDTPNRMPITYYLWRPAFASQPHRATVSVVLAEIGSLSMEFTRLAQFTKEPRYYDAVARITDNLEAWQNNTRVPGLWPSYLDASGCVVPTTNFGLVDPNGPPDGTTGLANGPAVKQDPKKPPKLEISLNKPDIDDSGHLKYPKIEKPNEEDLIPLAKPDPISFKQTTDKKLPSKSRIKNWDDDEAKTSVEKRAEPHEAPKIGKRQISDASTDSPKEPKCINGFKSTSEYGSEEFTLGAMADSTYEYLPKMYLLLGGLEDKYRTMYEYAADAAAEHLLYRPMTKTEEDILFPGKFYVGSNPGGGKSGPSTSVRLDAEMAHLACFAGGMYGMSAKLFGRDKDLEIGRKITQGCVWSYNMTASGIMPEAYNIIPCESKKTCKWNETKWWEELDPQAELRQKNYQDQLVVYTSQVREAMAEATARAGRERQLEEDTDLAARAPAAADAEPTARPVARDELADEEMRRVKRQLDDDPDSTKMKPTPTTEKEKEEDENEDLKPAFAKGFDIPSYIMRPLKPESHEERVKSRIKDDRLAPGVVRMISSKYILRPEAIESVFYMYRITGEEYWREAGWQMFKAIARTTRAKWGHSALGDVTKNKPDQLDEMESFWLAETLKYFYLLFETEDVISLDDWVFNTEAHPFKIPKKAVGE